MIGGLFVDASKESGNVADHFVAEIYDPLAKRWFYVEPQRWGFYGANSSNHILFGTDNMGSDPIIKDGRSISVNGMRYQTDLTQMSYRAFPDKSIKIKPPPGGSDNQQ